MARVREAVAREEVRPLRTSFVAAARRFMALCAPVKGGAEVKWRPLLLAPRHDTARFYYRWQHCRRQQA